MNNFEINAPQEARAIYGLLEEMVRADNHHCNLTIIISEENEYLHNCAWCSYDQPFASFYRTMEITSFESTDGYLLWQHTVLSLHACTEGILTILMQAGLNYDFLQSKFPIFYKIKRRANFIKHPKVRMFMRHPTYLIIKSNTVEVDGYQKTLDKLKKDQVVHMSEAEIDRYYRREDSDDLKSLFEKYTQIDNIIIVLESPLDLVIEFKESWSEVYRLVETNPLINEALMGLSVDNRGDVDGLVESWYEMQADIERGK